MSPKNSGAEMNSSWVLILSILAVLCPLESAALRQEVYLYNGRDSDTSDGHFFRNSVPDASKYELESVQRVCTTGVWAFFNESNYFVPSKFTKSSSPSCENIGMAGIGSFRRLAHSETYQDYAISLYSETDYQGEELFITSRAYAGVNISVKSLAWGGYDKKFELYEGSNFDGKKFCTPTSSTSNPCVGYLKDLSSTGLSRIGSLIQGC